MQCEGITKMSCEASLRIRSHFRIGENRGPRSESRTSAVRQLSAAARFGIENPQLLVTTSSGAEDDVSPVGRPGRILVFTFARELLRNAVAQVDHPDLKVSTLLLIGDRAAVGRPVRTRPVA